MEPGSTERRSAPQVAQTLHGVINLARFAFDKGFGNQRHGMHPYFLIGRSVRKPYSA